jgi:hypothetical protein
LERIPEPVSKSRHKPTEEKIRSASYATEFSCLKNTSEQKDFKATKNLLCKNEKERIFDKRFGLL